MLELLGCGGEAPAGNYFRYDRFGSKPQKRRGSGKTISTFWWMRGFGRARSMTSEILLASERLTGKKQFSIYVVWRAEFINCGLMGALMSDQSNNDVSNKDQARSLAPATETRHSRTYRLVVPAIGLMFLAWSAAASTAEPHQNGTMASQSISRPLTDGSISGLQLNEDGLADTPIDPFVVWRNDDGALQLRAPDVLNVADSSAGNAGNADCRTCSGRSYPTPSSPTPRGGNNDAAAAAALLNAIIGLRSGSASSEDDDGAAAAAAAAAQDKLRLEQLQRQQAQQEKQRREAEKKLRDEQEQRRWDEQVRQTRHDGNAGGLPRQSESSNPFGGTTAQADDSPNPFASSNGGNRQVRSNLKFSSHDSTTCVEVVPNGYKCEAPYGKRFLTNICSYKISVRWKVGAGSWGQQSLAPSSCYPVDDITSDQGSVHYIACSWDPNAGPNYEPFMTPNCHY